MSNYYVQCEECLMMCDRSPCLECQIKHLQAEIKRLKERIEFAVDYLPESPNKAIAFLTPALKGEVNED